MTKQLISFLNKEFMEKSKIAFFRDSLDNKMQWFSIYKPILIITQENQNFQ